MDLQRIRFMIEREVGGSIEDASVIQWANQVNLDIGAYINLPDVSEIYLTTDDLAYDEPEGLKSINSMWIVNDQDNGCDREYRASYRRFNGQIIFKRNPNNEDVLRIDFYRHMTYFDSINNEIDLEDRYAPLYVSYGASKYYKLPAVVARMGEDQARQESQLAQAMYVSVKQQVINLYGFSNDPMVIEERW